MEAFSLLKYWRGGGGGRGSSANVRTPVVPTTITASVPRPSEEEEEEEGEEEDNDNDEDDEGSFFDLEFAVPDENDDGDEEDDGSIGTDEERDFDFAVSSGGGSDRTDPNLALSPSDDLFFKGKLVQLEPSSIAYSSSEPNSKAQFPVSFLKSATKFRVFLLGFKKPKPPAEASGLAGSAAQKQQSRFFTVKFKVEEVPIVSLFTRDNSSRSSNAKSQKPQQPQPQQPSSAEENGGSDAAASADAKRFAKIVMQKYLKMIKPLYVKVSRRYGEKLRFSGQLSLGLGKASTTVAEETAAAEPGDGGDAQAEEAPAPAAPPPNGKSQKQGNLPAGLRVVCKHLGKSRSASAAAAAAVAAPPTSSQRRDDSLLQQQDGIQSAIAHCKSSFNNASKGTECGKIWIEESIFMVSFGFLMFGLSNLFLIFLCFVISDFSEEISLPRSSSDPSAGKSVDGCCPRNSMKGKEACI